MMGLTGVRGVRSAHGGFGEDVSRIPRLLGLLVLAACLQPAVSGGLAETPKSDQVLIFLPIQWALPDLIKEWGQQSVQESCEGQAYEVTILTDTGADGAPGEANIFSFHEASGKGVFFAHTHTSPRVEVKVKNKQGKERTTVVPPLFGVEYYPTEEAMLARMAVIRSGFHGVWYRPPFVYATSTAPLPGEPTRYVIAVSEHGVRRWYRDKGSIVDIVGCESVDIAEVFGARESFAYSSGFKLPYPKFDAEYLWARLSGQLDFGKKRLAKDAWDAGMPQYPASGYDWREQPVPNKYWAALQHSGYGDGATVLAPSVKETKPPHSEDPLDPTDSFSGEVVFDSTVDVTGRLGTRRKVIEIVPEHTTGQATLKNVELVDRSKITFDIGPLDEGEEYRLRVHGKKDAPNRVRSKRNRVPLDGNTDPSEFFPLGGIQPNETDDYEWEFTVGSEGVNQ